MTDQLTLPIAPAKRAPDAADVEMLCETLEGQGWMLAREILLALRGLYPGWHDRHLRELANASEGRIISGQRGYRLTREATDDECDHAESWLRHQARAMTERAVAIRRCRNTRPPQ